MKFLKNILIIIIAIGVITPYLKPVQAVSPKGLIGGFITEPIQAKKDAAHITALSVFAGKINALVPLCVPATAGASPGAIGPVPPLPYVGSCSQKALEADRKVEEETTRVSERGLSKLQKFLDFTDEIAYILLKRVILDRLVDAIIAWIQNDGKGSVIENWEQFFDDAGNAAAGEFVQGLGAGFLCSPFSASLRFSLIPVERFEKVTCTLDQIIGNINNFFEDFRSGNWLAYQETWYPRNNFYGGTIIAINEAAKAEALGRDAAEKEGLAARGFLSWTKEEYLEDPTGPYRNKNGDFAGAGYEGIRYKKIKRTITPGAVTADTVTQISVVTPITRLIHSEDLTAYLTAIIDAGINQLTKQGIKWLRDLASRNAPPRVNPQFPCAGLTGEAFSSCQASVKAEKSGFSGAQAGITSATTGSLGTRSELAATLQKSIDLQTSYVEALDKLITAGKGSGKEQELADEQQILDELNDKLESNQSFVKAMTQQKEKVENITTDNGITEQDYLNLGNTINTQFVGDEIDATQQLQDAQKELTAIQDKVNSKLPEILSQLPASSQSQTNP